MRLGYQLTSMFLNCDADAINDPVELLAILRKAVELLDYDDVSSLAHAFSPHGVTCVLVLRQSHLIAHSWPEYNVLIVDLFTCGEKPNLMPVLKLIQKRTNAGDITTETLSRDINHPNSLP